MYKGWKEVKVEEIADVVGGGTPSTKKMEYFNGNIPWITPKDLSNYHNRYICCGERNITQYGLENSSTRILPAGTVLFTSRAPIGYVAIAKNDVTTNQGFKSLIPHNNVDSAFLYYLMKHSAKKIESMAGGSTFKEISGSALKQFELYMPVNKEEQKDIADFLGTLDDKIELNRKMNETLEEMAQTLFKSWFIDFDPVHAKAKGQKPIGISEEIAALFPDRFEDSELGMIPRGWNVEKVGAFVDYKIGGDWGKEQYDSEHTELVNVLRGTDIKSVKNLVLDLPQRYIKQSKAMKRELKEGDIVIEISGGSKNQSTGRSIYISSQFLTWSENKLIPASFCRLFRCKRQSHSLFLSCLFEKLYNEGKMWKYQNQSTGISNFQVDYFLKNEIFVHGGEEILNAFFDLVNPLVSKKYNKETIILKNLRDELLPKLLSGEILVKEAKKQIKTSI